MKIFGIDFSGEKTDKGVVVSPEAYAQLEAKAAEIAKTEAKETAEAESKPLLEAINKLVEKVNAQGETIAKLKAFQDETPATAVAAASNPAASSEEPKALKPWEEFNQTYAKDYINGTTK